jgi:protoheme IX farnesyltransferase
MSASSIVVASPRTAVLGRALDYIELTKLRIAVMELVVVLAAGMVATWGQPEPGVLLNAMLGTLLVAASASAANQWLERRQDARMQRTADRPIAAGRLSGLEAIVFSAVCLVAGGVQLTFLVNIQSAFWALATWALYVLAYTPLKTKSALNTAVGAVAGAMPVLIGWTAVGGKLDARAAALLLVLFLWQFPHFMAIAWIYRRDYASAGYKMLTVVEPSGCRAGRQAVLGALALLPVSIVPVLGAPGLGSLLYCLGAVALGIGYLVAAALFWQRPTDSRARLLLKVSLVYLPTLLVTLMLAPWTTQR